MSEEMLDLEISGMQPLDEKKIEELKRAFPGLPETYFVFLARYGYGDIECLKFYEGPIAFTDAFSDVAPQPQLLPFCEDVQGWVYCFDVADHDATDLGRVVSVDPLGEVEDAEEDESQTFLEFLLSFFGDEDGYAGEDEFGEDEDFPEIEDFDEIDDF